MNTGEDRVAVVEASYDAGLNEHTMANGIKTNI